jgi:hypothetical protein
MRFLSLIGGFGLSCALASTASAQWYDDFDSYSPGPLCAQSLWDEWTGSSGVDANVDPTLQFTTPNSVVIVTDNDVVYDFSNLAGGQPSSGVWTASIKVYVPTGATGAAWYILMNSYPNALNWSVQTTFNASTGAVSDGANKRKIKYDEWVSLVVSIDLDNDRYDSWYGDKTLAVGRSWKGATGQDVIAANDIYGDTGATGSSGIYFDDARLEKTSGGALSLTSSPNPAGAGATLVLFSDSPFLNSGDPGALFSWTINGSFFIAPILFTSYDSAGEWTLSTTVPVGLSGIEAGLKAFAVPAGGKVLMSNEDLIVFL